MTEHKTVDVDPQQLQKAQEFWENFITGTKYVVLTSISVLILLALAFVKFT